MLGLPESISACLFDLDGVLAETGRLNSRAWAKALSPLFREHRQPHPSEEDYRRHIDGRPAVDGVRDLLAERGIAPPDEALRDLVEEQAVAAFTLIERSGVPLIRGSLRYLLATVDVGLIRVVVSTDPNTEAVLKSTGLDSMIDAHVDASVVDKLNLAGKPAPDLYLAGAELVDVPVAQTAVFDDALAGIEAARRGQFAWVVGLNRIDESHALALRNRGADVVVGDLADLL